MFRTLSVLGIACVAVAAVALANASRMANQQALFVVRVRKTGVGNRVRFTRRLSPSLYHAAFSLN
jgi:hypothetical protein